MIEGELKSVEKVDYAKIKLTVHAFVNGVEVASANVDGEGRYRLTFNYLRKPPATELRVLPAKFSHRSDRTLAFAKTFSPHRYVLKRQSEMAYHAKMDLMIPSKYLVYVGTVTKTYRMHGAVWATTFVGGTPISIDPLPGAKIEFYEVDVPMFYVAGEWIDGVWVWHEPKQTEAYLGYVYTGPDGSYDFEFDFSYKNSPWVWGWLFTDKEPDIRARISQYIDGIWKQAFEGPVDWNIVEDFSRDFFIPVEDIFPVPDPGVKPDEGFRYTSVGLLPIDSTRIVDGYATAHSGDPGRISSISHQPFCGTLRIFGLFAEAPPVIHYKVQIADADAYGPTGSWEDVTDPLHNRKWNDSLKVWEPTVLGPDPVTGLYTNIDIEPEADWHEHALKVTWKSFNKPNGYYALRIKSFDSSATEVGTYEMPVMRVDNDVPEATIEAIRTEVGPVNDCGALKLAVPPNRYIRFRVTAHDPEGHVLKYWVSGTRGKDAHSAGTTIMEVRPDPPGDVWIGVEDYDVDFIIDPLPLPLVMAGCTTLAYNFELHVHGLATDCYDVTPGSQRIKKETNLVVSEP